MNMSSKHDRYKKIIDEISTFFKSENFNFEDKSKGELEADLTVSDENSVYLINIKPSRVDSSDIMDMESLAAKASKKFKNKKIQKIVVSPSKKTKEAKKISTDWNIKIIEGYNLEKIKKTLKK